MNLIFRLEMRKTSKGVLSSQNTRKRGVFLDLKKKLKNCRLIKDLKNSPKYSFELLLILLLLLLNILFLLLLLLLSLLLLTRLLSQFLSLSTSEPVSNVINAWRVLFLCKRG